MIQKELIGLLNEAVDGLRADKIIASEVQAEPLLERPTRPVHGDFSTNIAMALSGQVGIPPRQLAERIVERIPESNRISKIEIAGPGFINFFLTHRWLHDTVREIGERRENFGTSDAGTGESVQVEFGSANPTGPITVANGRGITYGDALSSLLARVGYEVERENYINDAGTQADKFARSLEARYNQALDRTAEMPEEGYKGDYLIDLGKQLAEEEGMGLLGKLDEIKQWGLARMLQSHEQTLERFGVFYHNWMSEKSLHDSGKIENAIELLREKGTVFDSEGAVWFKATDYGHTEDRVLIRRDELGGLPTYLAADAAYLLDKLERKFDHLIYVWGPDHHGTRENLLAVARAFEVEHEVEILIHQVVNFLEGGQKARMSKRTGALITLDELMDEVGTDAARYTFLTRSLDSSMDFDFELVKAQSQENPVYYVQYAHARIRSILRHGNEQGIELIPLDQVDLEELRHDSEIKVMRRLSDFPEAIEVAAKLRSPYRLTTYAHDLAGDFHDFYRDCRVIGDDPALTQARLWLSEAIRQVLSNTLGILGVSAPERM